MGLPRIRCVPPTLGPRIHRVWLHGGFPFEGHKGIEVRRNIALMVGAPQAIPAFHSDDADFAALIEVDATPIGKGTSRTVFEIPGHLDKVLKVANNDSNAANWVEATIYAHLSDKSKFGEVCSISRSGKFLVMERLDDLPADGAAGFQFPDWWTDRKRENFGRSQSTGALKIRDYALVSLSLGVLSPMPSAESNAEMARWLGLFR